VWSSVHCHTRHLKLRIQSVHKLPADTPVPVTCYVLFYRREIRWQQQGQGCIRHRHQLALATSQLPCSKLAASKHRIQQHRCNACTQRVMADCTNCSALWSAAR
jgi:hypothetical protein